MDDDLRASDRDRESAAEHLRKSCVEGRITPEELEERLERAMSAVTMAQLSEVVVDLPPLATSARDAPTTTSPPAKPGPVGVLPFAHRVLAPSSVEETRWQVLSTIAPRLADHGYKLVSESPTGLVFEWRSRPAWTILLAIVAFPIGLLALTVTRDERIVISLSERQEGGTEMIIHGSAPRRIRKAFLNLRL